MKANIGKIDKSIRIIIGLVIIITGVYFDTLLGIIGLFFLISVYFSFCPIYKLLGIKTKKDSDKDCGSGCGCSH